MTLRVNQPNHAKAITARPREQKLKSQKLEVSPVSLRAAAPAGGNGACSSQLFGAKWGGMWRALDRLSRAYRDTESTAER